MEIVSFIILVTLGLCNLGVLLFKEYFKEKGKNIATKEDVEEITSKIETIKLEVSNLHYQKNELLEKRKLVLLEFFELFTEFSESYLKNISFIDSYIYQPSKINERTNLIINKKGEVERAFWKLGIYELEDRKFIDNIKAIYLQQLEYYQLTIDFLFDIENNSLFLSKTQLTMELAKRRAELKDRFISRRDELEKTTIELPNRLINIIRPKYLELFK